MQTVRLFIPDKITKENADEEIFSKITSYLADNLNARITIEKNMLRQSDRTLQTSEAVP